MTKQHIFRCKEFLSWFVLYFKSCLPGLPSDKKVIKLFIDAEKWMCDFTVQEGLSIFFCPLWSWMRTSSWMVKEPSKSQRNKAWTGRRTKDNTVMRSIRRLCKDLVLFFSFFFFFKNHHGIYCRVHMGYYKRITTKYIKQVYFNYKFITLNRKVSQIILSRALWFFFFFCTWLTRDLLLFSFLLCWD